MHASASVVRPIKVTASSERLAVGENPLRGFAQLFNWLGNASASCITTMTMMQVDDPSAEASSQLDAEDIDRQTEGTQRTLSSVRRLLAGSAKASVVKLP